MKDPKYISTHIYYVYADTQIEDWIVYKDGYVWYDEVGLIGDRKVYDSQKDAENALYKYAKEYLR